MDYSLLQNDYEKLLELMVAEHDLIRSEKWDQLNRFSNQKEEIIEQIQKLESRDLAWKQNVPETLKVLIYKVADLEQLNQNLVNTCISQKKIQLDDVACRIRKLKQLGHRYEGFLKPDKFSEQA